MATQDSEQALSLQTCSGLMIIIRDTIQSNDWLKPIAAEKMGVTQSFILDLENGYIEKFTTDQLPKYLNQISSQLLLFIHINC